MKVANTIETREFVFRADRIREAMAEKGLEGIIAFGAAPLRQGAVAYLCNFTQGPPKNPGHGDSGLQAFVLPISGDGALVAPGASVGQNIANTGLVLTGPEFGSELVSALKEKGLAKKKLGLIGLDCVPAAQWGLANEKLPEARFDSADALLDELRAVKSDAEIQLISMADQAGKKAVAAGLEALRPGVAETEIETLMRRAARNAGVESIGRLEINSGGVIKPRAWPPAGDRVLAKGDLVVLELAGWAGGYAFCASGAGAAGRAEPAQADFLSRLKEATDWMTAKFQPGAEIWYVLSLHRDRKIFPSAHGIGLDLCEKPFVPLGHRPEKPILRPNMVMSLEPSILDGGLGTLSARRTVLVTENGPRTL